MTLPEEVVTLLVDTDLDLPIEDCYELLRKRPPSHPEWRWLLASRIGYKRAWCIVAEYFSGRSKRAKVERGLHKIREGMYATELAGDVDAIDDDISQAIVASMATAYSVSLRALTDLLPRIVDAKTRADVDAALDAHLDQLLGDPRPHMGAMSEEVNPIRAFNTVAAKVPYVLLNKYSLSGWNVAVHEWAERPM